MTNIIEEKDFREDYGVLHHQGGIDLIPSNMELSGMPMEAAEEHFRRRREEYANNRLRVRTLKKEIRLVDGIMEADRAMPAMFRERSVERIREQEPEKTVTRNVEEPEHNRRRP